MEGSEGNEEFRKKFKEALSKWLEGMDDVESEVYVKQNITEEELVEELTIKKEREYPLSFFVQIGRDLLKDERYLLLKIADTFIKDNFKVKVTTIKGTTTYYEID